MNKTTITVAIVAVLAFAGAVWSGVGAPVYLDSNTGRTFPRQVNAGHLSYGGTDAGAVTILNGPRPLQGWVMVAGTGSSRSTGTDTTNVASWQDLGIVGTTGPVGATGATGSAALPPGLAGQVPVNIATGTATSIEYEAQNISIPGVSGTQDYVPVFTGNNTGTATATSSAITKSHLQQVSDGFNLYLPAPVLRMRSFAATSNTPAMLLLGRSHSDALGEFATTSSGDALGSLLFRGLSSTVSSAPGAVISAVQDGAAGATFVPTKFCLNTSSNAATFVDQLCLSATGNCSCSGNFNAANIAGTPGAFMIPIADSLGTLNSWVTTGANRALSNLTATSITQHLIPVMSHIHNIGSSEKRWQYGYFDRIVLSNDITGGNITATPGAAKIPIADGSGKLDTWITAGADRALSNLTTTTVNQSLLPATSMAVNLGSATKKWGSAYVNYIELTSSITGGNITATPGASKIPMANATGNLADWVHPRIWTNDTVVLSSYVTSTNAWVMVNDLTRGLTADGRFEVKANFSGSYTGTGHDCMAMATITTSGGTETPIPGAIARVGGAGYSVYWSMSFSAVQAWVAGTYRFRTYLFGTTNPCWIDPVNYPGTNAAMTVTGYVD